MIPNDRGSIRCCKRGLAAAGVALRMLRCRMRPCTDLLWGFQRPKAAAQTSKTCEATHNRKTERFTMRGLKSHPLPKTTGADERKELLPCWQAHAHASASPPLWIPRLFPLSPGRPFRPHAPGGRWGVSKGSGRRLLAAQALGTGGDGSGGGGSCSLTSPHCSSTLMPCRDCYLGGGPGCSWFASLG